jgi:hypothetical protein
LAGFFSNNEAAASPPAPAPAAPAALSVPAVAAAPAPWPADMQTWTTEHVALWMRSLGVPDKFTACFEEEEINGRTLKHMPGPDSLEALGVKSKFYREFIINNVETYASSPSSAAPAPAPAPAVAPTVAPIPAPTNAAVAVLAHNGPEASHRPPSLHIDLAPFDFSPATTASPRDVSSSSASGSGGAASASASRERERDLFRSLEGDDDDNTDHGIVPEAQKTRSAPPGLVLAAATAAAPAPAPSPAPAPAPARTASPAQPAKSICLSFLMGSCKLGDRCSKSHSLPAASSASPSNARR